MGFRILVLNPFCFFRFPCALYGEPLPYGFSRSARICLTVMAAGLPRGV